MEAGVARAPATCGELIQGTIGGRHFLVSCPIDWWVEAVAWPAENVTVSPEGRAKVAQAVARLLDEHDVRSGVQVMVRSRLPSGRGLGTSTAEIGSAIYAVSRLIGIDLSPLTATRLALAVEPSDSSLLPELALLDHRTGGLVIPLPPPPQLDVLVVDPGGLIDTVAFNAIDRSAGWRAIELDTRRALELLIEGLHRQDIEQLGAAATISARAGERVVGGTLVGRLAALIPSTGAVGVVSARSGTIAGLLLPPGAATPRLAEQVEAAIDGTAVRAARVISGGVRFDTTGALEGVAVGPRRSPPRWSQCLTGQSERPGQ